MAIFSERPSCAQCPHHVGDTLFRGLENDPLLETARTVRFIPQGGMLYRQGERPDGHFCLLSGRIKLFRTTTDGAIHILRWAEAGEPLGLRELHAGDEYGASAEAATDVVACHLDETTVQALAERHPVMLRATARRLARDLGRVEEEAVKTRRTVKQRMADLLLEADAGRGQEPDRRFTIVRQEMAQRVGTTPETFARILTEFQNLGWIRRTRRWILVDDRSALRHLAGEA